MTRNNQNFKKTFYSLPNDMISHSLFISSLSNKQKEYLNKNYYDQYDFIFNFIFLNSILIGLSFIFYEFYLMVV